MSAPGVGATAGDLLAAIRLGEISVSEVVSGHLESLQRVHAATNAVASFEDARALSDAVALDGAFAKGGVVGPLHGLPITVKDWIDVEGFSCAGESAENRNRRPQVDATVVLRLRRAGAIVIAKTRAWGRDGVDGRVTHPLDAGRSVGGSSSGEAVVVAAGASPLGIGSDSGGSIRLPAAWCGVFGLKPTAGRVPTTGHFPRIGALSDGRTQIGPLARSVDDLEQALAVMAGPDWRDAGAAPVPLLSSGQGEMRTARFAVVMGEGGWEPPAELATAVEDAAGALEAAGLTRVRWHAGWIAEALDITRRYWARSELSGDEVARPLWDWDRFRRRYLEAAEQVDLLVTPATAETAPLDRDIVGDDFVYTLPASLTGSPAVVVPAGRDTAGMPVSVQLVGRPWEDHRVLAAARIVALTGGA
jgi:amidase